MDLRQLKRFVVVAETKSFNKAAETLAVSQPSLTRSIQMLEGQLQLQLLDRGPRGVLLTQAGKELFPYAKAIINERERALQSLRSLRSKKGLSLSIGTEPAYSARLLPLAMRDIHASSPEISITVREGSISELLAMLREGEIDLAIGPRPPHLDLTGITFEQLDEEVSTVVMRAGHPLLQKGGPTYQDMLDAKWIASDRPVALETWQQIWLQHKVPPPPVAIQTSSTQLIRECLLLGDYVYISDYSTFATEIDDGRLVQVLFDVPVYKRPSGLYRRAEMRLSKTTLSLINMLRLEAVRLKESTSPEPRVMP